MKFCLEGNYKSRPEDTFEVFADSPESARRIASDAGIVVRRVVPVHPEQPRELGLACETAPKQLNPVVVAVGLAGFVLGVLLATALLACGTLVLWTTRTIWFERPDGDSLQYFDLMVYFGFGSAFLFLPAVVGGGLAGAWLATRREYVDPVGGS